MKTCSYSKVFCSLVLHFPLEETLLHCCNLATKTSTPERGQGQSALIFTLSQHCALLLHALRSLGCNRYQSQLSKLIFTIIQAGLMPFFSNIFHL